MNELIINR